MSLIVNRIRTYAAKTGCSLQDAKLAVLADKDISMENSNPTQLRIQHLEGVVRALLRDVVPHVRDTGHNAADREMSEAITAARAAVPN